MQLEVKNLRHRPWKRPRRRWSKLQKELYLILDPRIDLQLHCSIYRMESQRGSTDLPRYWITLNSEILFDYPSQFADQPGGLRVTLPRGITVHYPYMTDISDISALIRAYIDTPPEQLLTKSFDQDRWGLIDLLRAADRRVGKRRLKSFANSHPHPAIQKIIAARLAA